MNAAQAVALPKDRPQDRARRRPGSPRAPLYLVPSPAAGSVPGSPAVQPVVTRPAAARPVVTSPAASGVPTGSLRLTRRGRVVAAALAALLITALSLAAAISAQATGRSLPGRAAQQNLVQVMVRPGQSLWTVAESADPNADPRVVIQRIIDLNGLNSVAVQPGQQLWAPRS